MYLVLTPLGSVEVIFSYSFWFKIMKILRMWFYVSDSTALKSMYKHKDIGNSIIYGSFFFSAWITSNSVKCCFGFFFFSPKWYTYSILFNSCLFPFQKCLFSHQETKTLCRCTVGYNDANIIYALFNNLFCIWSDASVSFLWEGELSFISMSF